MKLSSILNPSIIYCDVEGTSREEIYGFLVKESVKKLGLSINTQEVVAGLIKREDDIRIPYEMNLAVPHLRLPALSDLYVIVGKLKSPVKLKENDMSETKLIVMSLISESTSDTYLRALSAFSRFFIKPGVMDEVSTIGKADDFLKILDKHNAELKKSLTAEDIMVTDFQAVTADEPISNALDIFTRDSRIELPVVDSEKRILGVINARNIMAKSIPPYIMNMDNIKFLNSFEPFEKVLSDEENMIVKDYMCDPKCVVKVSTPLIQVTLPLVKDGIRNVFVADDDNKMVGLITVQEIINKVLRG